MLLVYIGEDESAKGYLEYHLSMMGYKIIQYKNPLKAIDNIEELLPDVVLFCATDFPRHWKPFLQIYRQYIERDKGVFLLCAGPDFSQEEAAKAEFLKVNGIIEDNIEADITVNQLKLILARYNKIDEKRVLSRYILLDSDLIELIFTHPLFPVMITGKVRNISENTICMYPDNPEICSDLKAGRKINNMSITIGDDLFSADCTVLRNSESLVLQMKEIPENYTAVLNSYIRKRAERQLKKLVRK